MPRRSRIKGPVPNDSWVVEEGDRVIRKKAQGGLEGLTNYERLVYCLWVADYGMRNAGDLETARDVYPDFQTTALRAAQQMSLPVTCQVFAMDTKELEDVYFDRFDAMCNEIRAAASIDARHGK